MTFTFQENGVTVFEVEADSLRDATRKAQTYAAKNGPFRRGWPVLLAKVTDVLADGVNVASVTKTHNLPLNP